MAFEKYDIVDGYQAQIDVGISASATTITLKSGEGSGLKSGSQKTIVKLVQYTTADDPTTAISKFENVLVTNRSGDTLTVTRGFGGTTPTGFNGDDYVYATNHTEITTDMQDEITRLESDKLDDGELRSAIAGNLWKILFLNGSGVETALSIGSNGKYLRSNGTTSAPSWGTPPLDVNSQTTITTIDRGNDFLAVADASDAGSTKKISVDKIAPVSSTSVVGLAERATDVEAEDKSDNIRYVTPKHLGDLFTVVATDSVIIAPDNFTITDDPNKSEKGREITIKAPGVYRIKFNINGDTGGGTCSAQIKKNGVQVFNGNYDDSTEGADYETDQTFAVGDSLEIWGTSLGDNANVRNIEICGTIIPFINIL